MSVAAVAAQAAVPSHGLGTETVKHPLAKHILRRRSGQCYEVIGDRLMNIEVEIRSASTMTTKMTAKERIEAIKRLPAIATWFRESFDEVSRSLGCDACAFNRISDLSEGDRRSYLVSVTFEEMPGQFFHIRMRQV